MKRRPTHKRATEKTFGEEVSFKDRQVSGLPRGIGGHTLLELLVTLTVLLVVAAVAALSLPELVEGEQSRAAGQATQAALAVGQVQVLSVGVPVEVEARAAEIRAGSSPSPSGSDPEVILAMPSSLSIAGCSPLIPTMNVNRWRVGDGAVVGITWPFAVPNSAGSIMYGSSGRGARVVVRVGSGLTRRELLQ